MRIAVSRRPFSWSFRYIIIGRVAFRYNLPYDLDHHNQRAINYLIDQLILFLW